MKSKDHIFWVSFSDLMTSLFFLMLVLYLITLVLFNKERNTLEVQVRQLEQIKNVEEALSKLDERYFSFNEDNKRYTMAVDANFASNSSSMWTIPYENRVELLNAGEELKSTIQKVIKENPKINYLLVIEGNTARSGQNFINNPDRGYELSYERALALYNYWKDEGIDFRSFGKQCEVILAGSGYFGHSRDTENEGNNRRFSIQITSKVGEFLGSQALKE